MAKYEAGTAFIHIVPSMKGIHKSIRDGLKNLDDQVLIQVGAQTQQAEDSLRQFHSRVGSLTSFLQVEASTDRARADIQDLVAKRHTAEVGIEVTRNQADARLDALALTRPQLQLDVDADTAKAQEQIRKLQAERITGEAGYQGTVTGAQNRIRELHTYQDAESQRILTEIGQAQSRLYEYQRSLEETDYNTAAFNDLVNKIDNAEAQIDKLTEQQHSVGVQVEADTAKANAEIAEAASRWNNEQVRLDVGLEEAQFRQRRAEDRATENVVRTQAKTSQAQARIQDLVSQRRTVEIEAQIRDDQARAELQALSRQASTLNPDEVGLDVAQAQADLQKTESRRITGEAQAQAQVQRLESRIRELADSRTTRTVTVDADIEQAETELASLLHQIRDIENTGGDPVQLRANAAQVEETLRELRERRTSIEVEIDTQIEQANRDIATAQARWEADKVRIDLDTERARHKLEELQEKSQNIRLGVNSRGFQRATTLVLALTSGISALGTAAPAALGAVAAIPGVLTGMAQVIGTVAAGFHGVSDAAEQYAQVQDAVANGIQPTEDQLEDLKIAMSKLTQEGQTFTKFLVDDVRPALSSIGDGVQSTLLPKMQESLENLLGVAPEVEQALTGMGATLGDLAVRGSEMVSSGPWTQDFQTIAASNNRIITSLGEGGLMLADSFRSITVAAGPMMERFANWAQNQAILVNGTVQSARATGQLQATMQSASSTIARLVDMAIQLATAALHLATALAPVGAVVLDVVTGFTNLVEWLSRTSPLLLQIAAGALLAAGSVAKIRRGFRGVGTMFSQATGGMVAFGDASGRTTRSSSRLVRGVSRLGRSLPILGTAAIALAMTYSALNTSTGEVTDALLKGGKAAADMREQLTRNTSTMQRARMNTAAYGAGLTAASKDEERRNNKLKEAEQAMRDKLAAMHPLQAAQAIVNRETADYLYILRKYGPHSQQAAAASRTLSLATQRQERLQQQAALATRSHTDKLRIQRQVMLGSVQADLAFRQSKLQVTQAQRRLSQATNQYGAESRQARAAQLALEQALLRSVQAAGRAARAQFENQRSAEATKAALRAQNAEVIRLIGIMGAQAPPALLAMAAKMDQAALSALGARIETDRFGTSILVLPNGKRVNISTPGVRAAIGNVHTLQSSLNSLDLAKTVTISVNRVFKNLGDDLSGFRDVPFPNARGNLVQPGSGGLRPMSPQAAVVPPRTWRVVGDRLRGDEAYIPINDSRRSQAILTETARRMGYTLSPQAVSAFAAGGIATSAPAASSVHGVAARYGWDQAPYWSALLRVLWIIAARFDNPVRALTAFDLTTPGDSRKVASYDSGGWLRPGRQVVYNGTGRPEAVLTREDYRMLREAAHREPSANPITVNVRTDASPEHIAHTVDRHLSLHRRLE